MKWKSGITAERTFIASRRIFWFWILLIILAGTLSALNAYVNWKWLEIPGSILTAVIFILFIISWITPGLLVVLGTPQLVHAWLRGILGVRNNSVEGDSRNRTIHPGDRAMRQKRAKAQEGETDCCGE